MASGIHNIIYVDSQPDAACDAAINAAGGLVRSDLSALNPDQKFLRQHRIMGQGDSARDFGTRPAAAPAR